MQDKIPVFENGHFVEFLHTLSQEFVVLGSVLPTEKGENGIFLNWNPPSAPNGPNFAVGKAILVGLCNHRYVLLEGCEPDASIKGELLPPDKALLWLLENGFPCPEELEPEFHLLPAEMKSVASPSDKSPPETDSEVIITSPAIEQDKSPFRVELTFEEVTETEIGFPPENPFLGCKNSDELLDRVRNEQVELRVLIRTGAVIFYDKASGLIQSWEPPGTPNRGTRVVAKVVWEEIKAAAAEETKVAAAAAQSDQPIDDSSRFELSPEQRPMEFDAAGFGVCARVDLSTNFKIETSENSIAQLSKSERNSELKAENHIPETTLPPPTAPTEIQGQCPPPATTYPGGILGVLDELPRRKKSKPGGILDDLTDLFNKVDKGSPSKAIGELIRHYGPSFSISFEAVSEEEIGFPPDKPWMGHSSFEEFARQLEKVAFRYPVFKNGSVMFWDMARHLVQWWELPGRFNRGKRSPQKMLEEAMATEEIFRTLNKSGCEIHKAPRMEFDAEGFGVCARIIIERKSSGQSTEIKNTRTDPSQSSSAPSKTASQGQKGEPGKKDSAVRMGEAGEPIFVNGVSKELTFVAFKIVKALVEAGENGLSKGQLEKISTDYWRILKTLQSDDADWESVIHFPGKPYGRYRIR
jgi:hypothetical protein